MTPEELQHVRVGDHLEWATWGGGVNRVRVTSVGRGRLTYVESDGVTGWIEETRFRTLEQQVERYRLIQS